MLISNTCIPGLRAEGTASNLSANVVYEYINYALYKYVSKITIYTILIQHLFTAKYDKTLYTYE